MVGMMPATKPENSDGTALQVRPTGEHGFTLVEVAVCLGIFALLVMGFLRVITQSQLVEETTRETELVEEGLFVEIHALRGRTTTELRRLARSPGWQVPLQSTVPAVVAPPAGSAEGATYGGVEPRPLEPSSDEELVGLMRLEEVGVDGHTPSTTSGYFKVTAAARWEGVLGRQQVQIISWVTSHRNGE